MTQMTERPAAPPARPGERLRTVRTLVIGVVLMWVVLVGAWAVDRAATQNAFAGQRRDAENARARLAGVEELSGVFNNVNTAVEPAVVKLDVVRPGNGPGRFQQAIPQANSGSGVIVELDENSGRGYVVTNNHVVANAARINVTLADGRTVDARVVGTDPESDLAVVSIDEQNLLTAPWGDSTALKKGDWVLAFGSPFNFVGSMTAGIVSALQRTADDGIGGGGPRSYMNYIQTDAAINPGNSGGPLVNVRGEVVGINTAIFSRTGDFSGIGFAIPSNQARKVYQDIREKGRVVRGYLGVRPIPVGAEPEVARRLGYEGQNGVILREVYRDTPADDAGLLPGDIVLKFNDTTINNAETLRNVAAFAEVGQQVRLTIFRGGGERVVEATIGELPEDVLELNGLRPIVPEAADGGSFGLTLQNAPGGAVLVTSVDEASPASEAGLQSGDVLVGVNRRPVRSARQAQELLADADPRTGVEVTVGREDRLFNLLLRPPQGGR